MPAKRTARGNLFQRGKQGRWYCQHYITGKQIITRLLNPEGQPCQNRKEAEAARDELLAPLAMTTKAAQMRLAVASLESVEARAAALVESARPKMSIAGMWERHPYETNTRGNTERRLSATTVKDNESQWGKFVAWATAAGIRFAEDVTPDHALKFRQHLATDGLSGDRQNKIVGLCAVMFRLSGIEPNPFDGLRKQAHRQKGRRELSADELKAVCTSAAGDMRTLLAVGLFTGLRLGDAARLEWGEVASDLSSITRIASKTQHTGKGLSIPIHPTLQAIFAETPPEGRNGYVLPTFGPMYEHDKSALSKRIQKHFESCGIQTHKPGTGKGTDKRAVVDVGFHSLRHSFISVCARQGTPLHVVRAIVGHSSPAIQERYLHASNADAEKAIAALPSPMDTATDPEAADRAALVALAGSLPIAAVRRLLASTKSAKPGEKPAENGQ